MHGDAEVSPAPESAPGDWFDATWRIRLVRRLALSPIGAVIRHRLRRVRPDLADDARAWFEARAATERHAWRHVTRTSYSVLCYHRLAGAGAPGQERIDVPPGRFAMHLRTLRRLGFRPMTMDEIRRTHGADPPRLGRRRYLLTADDGFADCVNELVRRRVDHAWMFVPTAEVGNEAAWAHGGAVASWDDLKALAELGVTIGSHGMTHTPFTELGPDRLRDELTGSHAELTRHGVDHPVLAYPNGVHDASVCDAARAAGYELAFTTQPGRNGPQTDPLRLRRITPKAWDSRTSLIFKVVTGEQLPARWEARRLNRHGRRQDRRARLRARTSDLAPARRLRLRLAARAISDAFGQRAEVRLLDAGCQDGLLALRLGAAHPEWTIVGVDLDPDAVRVARGAAQEAGAASVHFAVGDLCHPPTGGAFDIVAAMECLAEIPDDAAAVRGMAQALRSGGRLLIHVPEASWRPVLPGSVSEWSFAVRHGYREDHLRRLLQDAGLEEIQITATSHAVLQAAQEIRDRFVRGRGIKARLAALPVMAAVVRLELAGWRVGRGRALFAQARKP